MRSWRVRPVWRTRASLLVALLALTVVLAAVLAYEAHDAARSHRATAKRALHDYATFAAWELLAKASDALQPALTAAMAPVTASRAGTPWETLPPPDVLAATSAHALPCADPADDDARSYLRLDFRDGSLAAAGAPLPAAMRERLRAMLTRQAQTVFRPDWRWAALLAGHGADARALAYGVKYTEHGAPLAVYAIVTCASALGAPVFAPVMARRLLLPQTLAAGLPNDSLVAVTVLDAVGDTLWRSAARGPSPFIADAAVASLGGLTARAALRPLAIERMALGAIPRSRLTLLLSLLGLTAGMMVVAILQLRREQELAQLRSDFISSVSHELRTPLAQILLFAETLSLGRVRSDAERAGAADVIVQEGRRLMHLVENVLHVSRAERRMTRLAPEPVPLDAALGELIEAWRPLAAGRDVRIETAPPSTAVARADPAALRQMLLNLLDNAVKYGPRGQTVRAGTAHAAGHARVWVEDEGPGVPPAARARVWEPFFRLEHHAQSAQAGCGIGLFVVRELAALQDGTAWVEEAPGGGARFVIELPAAAPDATPEPRAREAQPERVGA